MSNEQKIYHLAGKIRRWSDPNCERCRELREQNNQLAEALVMTTKSSYSRTGEDDASVRTAVKLAREIIDARNLDEKGRGT